METIYTLYEAKKLSQVVPGVGEATSIDVFAPSAWIKHVPEGYKHTMRYFGLFAPRAVSQTSAAIFAIIGQKRRPRPMGLRWADSLKRDFGKDPLLDRSGHRMRWVRRLTPQALILR